MQNHILRIAGLCIGSLRQHEVWRTCAILYNEVIPAGYNCAY